MAQEPLPDVGHSDVRFTNCPQCGRPVTWSLAKSHADALACRNEVGERVGAKKPCGFKMRVAEWEYLRQRPEKAKEMRAMFGKEPTKPRTKANQDRIDRVLGKESS